MSKLQQLQSYRLILNEMIQLDGVSSAPSDWIIFLIDTKPLDSLYLEWFFNNKGNNKKGNNRVLD